MNRSRVFESVLLPPVGEGYGPMDLAVQRVIDAFDAQRCLCDGQGTCLVCADLAGAA